MKLLNLFAIKNQENAEISGGRSMVEMLGVLAIIGVLSVGGIVGYNTAMYKHRMNKTIETFSQFMSNLIEVSNEKWENGQIYGREDILGYDLLSEEQCPVSSHSASRCRFPLGELEMFFTHNEVNSDIMYGYFYIYFYEGDKVKSCVDFLSQGWQNMYPPEWLGRARSGTGSYIRVSGSNGRGRYLWTEKPYFTGVKQDNITLSDVQAACDYCKGVASCQIYMDVNH